MRNNNFKKNLKYPKTYKLEEQTDIQNKLMLLLDEYEKNNSFDNREFLCYLTAAIYLTYRDLYPQLNIYIPFRTKSDISFIKNIQKEFSIYIKDQKNKDSFDTHPITKDISGIRIVLNNINFSLPSTEEYDTLFSDPEIKKLMKIRHDNFHFIDDVTDYIQSPIQNGKRYFELKKELLDRIIKITPSKFKNERMPNLSYAQLYKDAKYKYSYFLENDNFPTTISNSEITELNDLLNEFRSKIDDQLHFSILRKTLPIVFDRPLIKNVLKTSFVFDKESSKENGFQSIYYALNTPFGPVEVQSQSNRAYYSATKGSAYHSGLDGKSLNVNDFFELVDPNDKFDLLYYLSELDSTSADTMISPYEIPEFKTEQEKKDFYNTREGFAYLQSETYREMMKHIKIKDKIQILPQYLPNEVYDNNKNIDEKKLKELIDSGTIKPTYIDTNIYLFSMALALSPYMNVCSSGHTSFTNAGIHHKKIIGEFAEVLRKKDSNTCLRDILIRRLEQLIDHPERFFTDNTQHQLKLSLSLAKKHNKIEIKLPKDISKKNIIGYGERVRHIEKSYNNLEL